LRPQLQWQLGRVTVHQIAKVSQYLLSTRGLPGRPVADPFPILAQERIRQCIVADLALVVVEPIACILGNGACLHPRGSKADRQNESPGHLWTHQAVMFDNIVHVIDVLESTLLYPHEG
jgi:hypothetical protein